MMIIIKNAIRERMRKKEIYVFAALGILLLLLFGGGSTTLQINGVPVTDFSNMFGIMHGMVTVIGCLLALLISLQTIPNEYERRTSHLVWVRGISQTSYHTSLALANFLSGVIAVGILYMALVVYVIGNGETGVLIRMIPAFLILCINIGIISLLTSVLSIKLPAAVSGLIGAIVVIGGLLYGILDTYRSIMGGITGSLLGMALRILPDFNHIRAQSAAICKGDSIEWHGILVGLLTIYIVTIGLVCLKRKEA